MQYKMPVRYMEDREPIGFNYVKLGLQDVLLDPKTGEIYTPNTNQLATMEARAFGEDIAKLVEQRLSVFGGGAIGEFGLTGGGNGDIIEERARHYTRGDHGYFTGSVSGGNGGGGSGGKARGTKSSSRQIRLSKKEYGKIVSEINTNYSKYEGKRICRHNSFWNNAYHTYEFINNGFDNYVFTRKR